MKKRFASCLAAPFFTVLAGLASDDGASGAAAAPDSRRAMITALPASGPHPSLRDQAPLFDRFVGTWDCDYATYAPDGSVHRSSGEVIFGWIIDGRALQDIWITYPEGAATEREIGTTVRYYDTRLGQWRVVWIDPVARTITVLGGGAEGDRIVLVNRAGDGTMRRWSFNDILPDSFVWRGEKSPDGGKTWRREAEYHLKRRSLAPDSRTSAPPRDARGDMITALPTPGPHPSLGREADLFDRFVGTWDCAFTTYAADGTANRFSGELLFGWIIDGRALQDIWIGYPKGGSPNQRSIGTSVRFFDIGSRMWRAVWIAPAAGEVITLAGGARGDRIVFLGRGADGAPLRWSYNEIRPDSFVWRSESSRDGGKTWWLQEEHRMKRRGTAPAASRQGLR